MNIGVEDNGAESESDAEVEIKPKLDKGKAKAVDYFPGMYLSISP